MKTVVVGGQYGDEGKGKIVSYLAKTDSPDIAVRGGVGPNAGHTVVHEGRDYGIRMIPCAFVNERVQLGIGRGVLVNPKVFLRELEETGAKARTRIDRNAGLITDEHIERDKSEASDKIGTTKTGCGPAQGDRVARIIMKDGVARTALRVTDAPELEPYLADIVQEVNAAENVLVEGSQGFMISLYNPGFPYVTSKDTTASSVAADVGLGPTSIDEVILVVKAYTTRVGNGFFCHDEISAEQAKERGMYEEGTVTHRPRRICPKLHIPDIQRAALENGATQIALTKVDILFPDVAGAFVFDDLTGEAKKFVRDLEEKTKLDVTLISTGRKANETIDLRIRR